MQYLYGYTIDIYVFNQCLYVPGRRVIYRRMNSRGFVGILRGLRIYAPSVGPSFSVFVAHLYIIIIIIIGSRYLCSNVGPESFCSTYCTTPYFLCNGTRKNFLLDESLRAVANIPVILYYIISPNKILLRFAIEEIRGKQYVKNYYNSSNYELHYCLWRVLNIIIYLKAQYNKVQVRASAAKPFEIIHTAIQVIILLPIPKFTCTLQILIDNNLLLLK